MGPVRTLHRSASRDRGSLPGAVEEAGEEEESGEEERDREQPRRIRELERPVQHVAVAVQRLRVLRARDDRVLLQEAARRRPSPRSRVVDRIKHSECCAYDRARS